MIHKLKIRPGYFEAVLYGSKTFEVRKNDRGFNYGDEVLLQEWFPEAEKYSGRAKAFRVGYVLPIDGERVVFSLLPIENKQSKEVLT